MPSRRVLFGLVVAACVIASGAAIVTGARRDDGLEATTAARDVLPEALAKRRPTVVFRSLGRERGGGELVAAAIGPRRGPRTSLPLRCDRMHFAAGRGLCLARGGGFASGYRARVFDAELKVRHELAVAGIPSRVRVSPDGRYGSVTLFVAGHSYAEAGEFSTQTTLIDLDRGQRIAELEQFAVTRAGRHLTAVDMNFWGVTFARDSDRFFATLATGGRTYLIQGSVRSRSAKVIDENVECPSLSPDGSRIAYKRRGASTAEPWRLTVLDLDSMRDTPLAETRSVDDQVEWLDGERVLYGVGRAVWVARADGGGRPRRFVPGADSPAVLRF